jgi:hypothetical protein
LRIVFSKRPTGEIENFARGKLVANNLKQEKIVQLVGTDMLLGFLADVTILIGRQKFRGDRRRTNIVKDFRCPAAEFNLREPFNHVTNQGFGYR